MPETVMVTGGLGRSGRWIVDRIADDYDVVCVDLEYVSWEEEFREGVTYRAADLTDAGETFDLIDEVAPDAVVHWAAIPTPRVHAGNRVFETNATSTWNALVAAARTGARVVWASSETVYGYPYAPEPTLPDSLPIDETHPRRPYGPYATAKVAGEEVAEMVVRKYGIDAVSVRPMLIQHPGDYGVVERGLEGGAFSFWSYVDVRDVAGIVEAVLAADPDGYEVFNAAAPDNYLGRPTADLLEAFFGERPRECDLEGEESAFSTAKAREMLDWEPSHSWRAAAEQDVEAPAIVR